MPHFTPYERPKTRRRLGSRLTAMAAGLALLSACTGDSNESTGTAAASTPNTGSPVKSFDALTRRTAEAITCILTSDKTRTAPASKSGGNLSSLPGSSTVFLNAARKPRATDGLGAWSGAWSKPTAEFQENIRIVHAEGFIPPDSTYWQGSHLTPNTVEAGVRDMKGYSLGTTIIPYEDDHDGIDGGEIAYTNTSPAERDPSALSVTHADGKWRPATEEDVKLLEQDVNQVLGTLMAQSQITDCLARP